MPYSFLIFDFGENEEAARKARLAIEGWKQAFRLDRKMLLKFDRGEGGGAASGGEQGAADSSKQVNLIVRLDFSDHERLSHQRWLERIPSEPPFRDASPRVIRPGDPELAETANRFDELP